MATITDRDTTSTLIRYCRWMLWAAMLVLWCLLLPRERTEPQKHVARIEWLGWLAAGTGNFLLYEVERRRKRRLENDRQEVKGAETL
jgi:hypothetical protein